jgi:hypothetical protein
VTLLPDSEATAIRYLAAHPDIAALGARVSWVFDATVPHLVVTRTGGVAPWPPGHTDRPRLDIDTWAGSKESARDLAETARQAMHAAVGQTLDGVVICDCAEVVGLTYLPDDDVEGTPHYVFTIEWTVHI